MIKRKKIRLLIPLVELILIVIIMSSSVSVFAEQQMVDFQKYEKAPPYKVAFDIYYKGNAWGVLLFEEFKAEVARHPDLISEVLYTDSEGNTAKQISNIEDLIVRNPDLLVLTPNSFTSLVPVIEKAYSKGIAVVLCAAGADTEEYTSYINIDDFEYGVTGAEWLVETIGYKGKIVGLLGVAGNSAAEDTWKGALSVFDKYPEVKVIASEYCNWTFSKAKMAMENIIAAQPELDGIFTVSGGIARGAIEALLAAGREIPPICANDENGFLKMWKKYNLTAFAYSKPVWLSQRGLQIGLDILQGKPTSKVNVIPSPTITKETLDEFVRPNLPDSLACDTHLSIEKIEELFPRGE